MQKYAKHVFSIILNLFMRMGVGKTSDLDPADLGYVVLLYTYISILYRTCVHVHVYISTIFLYMYICIYIYIDACFNIDINVLVYFTHIYVKTYIFLIKHRSICSFVYRMVTAFVRM